MEFWLDQAKRAVAEELWRLAHRGVIELAISRRLDEEVPAELAARLRELPIVKTGDLFRIRRSTIGGPDFLGSGEFDDFLRSAEFAETESDLLRRGILAARRRPSSDDWDHVHAHYATRRDVFLTWDRGLLAWSEPMHGRFRIVVMKPETYVQELRSETEDDVASRVG